MSTTLTERLGRLEERMNRVEKGIDSFENFQMTAQSFFDRADERATVEMEFHNKRDQEIKDALTIAAERTNRWMLLIAILSLIAVSVGVYIGVREYQRKLSAMRPDTVVLFQQKSQADDYGS